MNTSSHTTIDLLLERWNHGDRQAAERLMPKVYDELRRIAQGYFRRERRGHTLQPTDLVHELYLEMTRLSHVEWRSRSHFYGLAGCMMRRALVVHSRRRAAKKRGGDQQRVPLLEDLDAPQERSRELERLDDALRDLERLDPIKALIVELRFFGGLTVEETGECLDLSPRSVARHWHRARLLLFDQLSPEVRDAL